MNRPLDIINGGTENNQPILAPLGSSNGQYWTLTPLPQDPRYVFLHSDFRGLDFALEGTGGATGNRPVLTPLVPTAGQTWLLTPLFSVNPATARVFGTACRGRGGLPRILPTNNTGPWIGETMTGEVSNVLSGMLSELILGQRLAFPIDLAPVGSPGCLLRVGPDLRFPNQVAGGRATFTLPIPLALNLVGLTWSIQCTVVDPARRPSDPLIAMTEGLELSFGLR